MACFFDGFADKLLVEFEGVIFLKRPILLGSIIVWNVVLVCDVTDWIVRLWARSRITFPRDFQRGVAAFIRGGRLYFLYVEIDQDVNISPTRNHLGLVLITSSVTTGMLNGESV